MDLRIPAGGVYGVLGPNGAGKTTTIRMLTGTSGPDAGEALVLGTDGAKMSKSRGTFIKARTYLDHLNPEYLRYYFAAKLTGSVDDMDLNLEDFVQKVNSDLVGKVVNIASRSAGFLVKRFDGKLAEANPETMAAFAATTASQTLRDFAAERRLRAVSRRGKLAYWFDEYGEPG